MKNEILHYIDFEKVNILLEGFNKSTGFVTAILDLEGNILSNSGWRQICTEFHRINPETAGKCKISDTVLSNKMRKGEKYHFYECLNGLVDVAVPIVINGEHIANLFSGQFFFKKPDIAFFKKQAAKHGFDEERYLKALQKVPIITREQVKTTMDFLLNMTLLISEMTFQKLEQADLNKSLKAAKEETEASERVKSELLTEANKIREQFSQMLERISDGFGSLDRNWNYTFVNEKLAQHVGRHREDLLGRNIWDEFPEAIGTPVHKAYLRAMEEQVVIDMDHYYTPWGRWFQHRFYPSPDGLSVFSKDITESKLAEEKIRANNSLIRIAAEKSKLGGWNVDLKEDRSYWSDVVAAIHEMPPGYAPLVEDGINFYAPECRARIKKVFNDCAGKGIPYDEELEIITASGKRVWVRTIGEAVRNDQGQIFKVQGALQDISQRKTEEEKIREKDLQFRKLSANVPDLIFQFTRKPDGTYHVPVASEGIRNIFGCSPDDVLDDFAPIARVLFPEDAERVIRDIEYSAEHLTYFTCEFRVQIPGRPIQWIYSKSSPEKLPDGSITWYGFNADITFRKEAEEAIKLLNSELEQRVNDRTSQLEAANKELEAFSYSVSHDLRAPLRHINGFAEILGRQYSDKLPDEGRKYLNTIIDSAHRMGNLIDDLLSFSRTGRAELKKTALLMEQVVKDVLTQIDPFIQNRKIVWSISSMPEVYGDYNLLKLVWINLIDNAVKFTRNAETAEISLGFKELNNEFTFYIRDNGVGFDMKYAQKLFGVFQRLHTAAEFDGTGIGLANVRRIILRHGGNVWAEAEPGKGAAFYFSIPKYKNSKLKV